MKSVAIHQPNYWPWLGYFFKIWQADTFVFLEDAQYSKRSYTRRTLVRKQKNSDQSAYLTVPLLKHSDYTSIDGLIINNDLGWTKRHLHHIQVVYGKSPFFKPAFELIAESFLPSAPEENLAKLNRRLIQNVCDYIALPYHFESSLEIATHLAKDARNLAIVQHFGGYQYLSGKASYQNDQLFISNGIAVNRLQYMDYFRTDPYPQGNQPTLLGLSIIDALMYLSSSQIRDYFHAYQDVIQL